MIWRVLVGGREAAVLAPSDVFFAWLAPRVRDPEIGALDPYRTAPVTLERPALERWRAELARVQAEWRDEVGAELARKRRLPRHADTRDAILAGWIDRELERQEHARTLADLDTAVELALDAGGVIIAVGD